jgi:bacteriocin-like protein
MEVAVVEKVAVEVQELTLSELAQVSGGVGDAVLI